MKRQVSEGHYTKKIKKKCPSNAAIWDGGGGEWGEGDEPDMGFSCFLWITMFHVSMADCTSEEWLRDSTNHL